MARREKGCYDQADQHRDECDLIRRDGSAAKARDNPILNRRVEEPGEIQHAILRDIARESFGHCDKIRRWSGKKDWPHVLAKSHHISWLSRRIARFDPAGGGIGGKLIHQRSRVILSREPISLQQRGRAEDAALIFPERHAFRRRSGIDQQGRRGLFGHCFQQTRVIIKSGRDNQDVAGAGCHVAHPHGARISRAETQRYLRARPRRFHQMGRYLFRRIRKDDGLAEPEPLHNPKQPFQKRNTEKNAERVGSVGEDD